MMKYFNFEFSRMKKILIPLGLTTGVLQLLFLYFFALVGRFDTGGENTLLTGYHAVLGLATTGTMCVLVIYGTVLASQQLVRDYVGMNKSKTYLLPISRKELFYTKTKAFSAGLSLAMLVGLLGANLLFMLSNSIVPLTKDPSFSYIISIVVSTLACVSLTLAMVLSASFIGIKLNSTTKGIIASIILVVLLSNLSAITLIASEFGALLVAVVVMGVVIMIGIGMGHNIDRNEVL
jgi:hypothetical protein